MSAESVGSMPVRQVVEQGLDIMMDNLASLVLAVQVETGADEEEEEGMPGMVEPDMGGGMTMTMGGGAGGPNGDGGYGQGVYGGGGGWGGGAPAGGAPGWAGSGMSPLRR